MLAGTGCALRPSPSGPSPSGASGQLQEFLESRAELLAEGNVESYLEPVGPAALALEGPIATGATTVPLTDIVFRLSPRGEPPSLEDQRVDLTYAYEGLPSNNSFRLALEYDFARTGDSWTIEGARLQEGTQLPVWATGPVLYERSEHFLALFRPDLEDPTRVLTDAEEARAQLGEKVPFPLESSYLLLIAGSEEHYSQMAGTTLGPLSPIAQVETSYEVTPEQISVLARQMVINRTKLYESGQTLETLRHELGHFLLARVTRPFTPAWVSEAAAMYLAGTRTADLWREGAAGGDFDPITIDRLTRSASLGEHDATREGTSLEYAYSAAAGWYLVETYGAARFWDFYASYAELPAGRLYERLPDRATALGSQARTSLPIKDLATETTNEALLHFFDLTPTQLDARIRQWMAGQ